MPLDPQVRRMLDQLAAAGAITHQPSAEERRAAARARGTRTVEDRGIPGPGGDIPIRIYTPPGPPPLPVLVYCHGGGWVTGDLDSPDLRCRILSDWAGCIVVSVNYRHAPEHPFPAAVDDAYAATCWVAEHAATFGGDVQRVAVGGDSAGGNLAAATALLARDRGGPRLVFQYLVYPVIDCDFTRPSYQENAEGYLLTHNDMAWFWDQYVPDPAMRTDPRVAPIRAESLAGLPPAFIITAEFDPLRDEGEAYAARLREAGVPVELKRYDGMIHGFFSQAAVLDQGKIAQMDSARALRAAFAQAKE